MAEERSLKFRVDFYPFRSGAETKNIIETESWEDACMMFKNNCSKYNGEFGGARLIVMVMEGKKIQNMSELSNLDIGEARRAKKLLEKSTNLRKVFKEYGINNFDLFFKIFNAKIEVD